MGDDSEWSYSENVPARFTRPRICDICGHGDSVDHSDCSRVKTEIRKPTHLCLGCGTGDSSPEAFTENPYRIEVSPKVYVLQTELEIKENE